YAGSDLKTAWIIHGYRPTGSTPTWLQKFQSTLLMEEDMNVIVVDWSQGATTFIYNRAVKNTRVVADILSKSIINLVSHGASLDSFHFIGMSLGAHVSGFVGKKFSGQIGRITGLDPAGPKFSGTPPNSRLDYTDAKFVDIIHSDAEGLGIQEPLGHIDFYPNGGKTQPGCPKTVFSGTEYFKCEHQRAIHLYLAALQTNCNFISFPCGSYKNYKKSLCVNCGTFQKTSCPMLGYKAKLWKESLQSIIKGWPRRTIAFLDTTDKYPFCAYYFVLSIIPVDAAMNSGSITLKMLSQHGVYETANIYEKNKPFAKFQEVKILVTFLSDMAIISSIRLTYFQNAPPYCPKCRYRIYRLTLKSLTYPERPPFCRHNIVLREKQEVILPPESCTENDT
uniref:lipase member I n=1 Tax=Jaculus jaculus TaxID=51337 RepID=UPI001E1B0074